MIKGLGGERLVRCDSDRFISELDYASPKKTQCLTSMLSEIPSLADALERDTVHAGTPPADVRALTWPVTEARTNRVFEKHA